ncbi:MAG: AMP-binding protein [Acidimicrobiia bacterium]|nr:AMP-binding protein [Acidimicrobiia bacterium]
MRGWGPSAPPSAWPTTTVPARSRRPVCRWSASRTSPRRAAPPGHCPSANRPWPWRRGRRRSGTPTGASSAGPSPSRRSCRPAPNVPGSAPSPCRAGRASTAVIVPLMAGATLVLAEPGEPPLDAIVREGVGYAFMDLDAAFTLTRESKRDVKSVRGVLTALLLSVDGPFDSDQRRRVGRLFEAPALTVYGRPETGPIFASHPSWYLDEAVGIPLSNAHVVPVDPRSGNPIPTLWELVESAMVTVWSPMLTVGYEGDAHPERFRDGRFLTGVIASSDANGMIYILPD